MQLYSVIVHRHVITVKVLRFEKIKALGIHDPEAYAICCRGDKVQDNKDGVPTELGYMFFYPWGEADTAKLEAAGWERGPNVAVYLGL